MREVAIAIKRIDIRMHNELVFQARIHGQQVEFKGTKDESLTPKLTDQQEARLELEMKRSMERKTREVREARGG